MNISLNGKELEFLLNMFLTNLSLPNKIKFNTVYKKLKRALMPIKISSRKAKGRNLQQQVCRDIANILDIEYNQQDDNCLIHSREMGQAGKDIILRGNAQERFPYSIECKSTELLKLYKAIEQAKKNMNEKGYSWIVVHKKKNNNPIAIIDWGELCSLLYREYNE